MRAEQRDSILVVDDEPQVLVALEDMLSDEFVVLKSGSAREALELVQTQKDIAVVVSDQRMPDMTGDELLAQLGDAEALRILLTGFADLSAVVRAVNEGRIFAYVTKPWDAEDLRLKVQKAAEHFRLARELSYERQLLHDLMNNVPDGIYFKDRERRFLRANRAFSRLVNGASPEGLTGKRSEDVLAPDLARATDDEERRVLEQGEPTVDVLREYRLHDGSRRWFSETRAPIRDAIGRSIGLVCISRDVTERVATQEALRASEERSRKQSQLLDSILQSMGEGVVAVDRNGRFLLFNQQAERLLGPGPHDVHPHQWSARYGMVLPDRKTPLEAATHPLLRAMQGEEVREMEVFIDNEDVRGASVAITATPLHDHEDRLVGGIALLRDVTVQRRLEQELLHSQKMEAIGRLAGGIAHDFNNLLAVIASYGELVFQELSDGDPRRPDLAEVLAAAHRAASLTRQLLAFSRKGMLQPRQIDLNEVVSGLERMLRRIIGEDIELCTLLAPSLGAIRADAGQMEQIILNLSVNARDAMPRGGRLTIETANVAAPNELGLGDAASGEYVMLSVSDTGTGMDAETQKHIFEPFFTTKEAGRGTGRGLATVYGIVQQSDGHIRVSSELDRGTRFTLFFPKVDGRTDRLGSARVKTLPPTARATVLLVEDDDAVRQVAARILKKAGCSVLEARRATEARRLCREHAPKIDLLLTDVVMPEIDGPRLAEELTGQIPGLPVLFMSGYSGVGPAPVRLGDDASYLEKPFTPASLLEKVQQALGWEGARDPNPSDGDES